MKMDPFQNILHINSHTNFVQDSVQIFFFKYVRNIKLWEFIFKLQFICF